MINSNVTIKILQEYLWLVYINVVFGNVYTITILQEYLWLVYINVLFGENVKLSVNRDGCPVIRR